MTGHGQFKVASNQPHKPGTSDNCNAVVAYGRTPEEAWRNAVIAWAGVEPSDVEAYKRTMFELHGYRLTGPT